MIFLDFETTGLCGPLALPLEKQPHITEATLAIVDEESWKELKRESFLINPLVPIPMEVTKGTGITDAMVKSLPSFNYRYATFCEMFCGQKLSVAHNCAFEMQLLEFELRRIGRQFHFPWTQNRLCTVEASLPIKSHRLKLGELHELATGKPFKGAHRTDADVTALITVTRWLLKQRLVTMAGDIQTVGKVNNAKKKSK